MTSVQELRRTKFTPREIPTLNNKALLEEAKVVLGYRPAALTEEDARLKTQEAERAVAKALEALGIDPLDSATVAEYKAAKIDEAEKKESSRFVRYMHASGEHSSTKGETVIITLTVLMAIAAIATGVCVTAYISHGHTLPAYAATALRAFWGTYLSAYVILMYARHKTAFQVDAAWSSNRLAHYSHPVPDFALARAVALRKELPAAADLYVEQLTVSTKELATQKYIPPPSPDPFLYVIYHDVKLYLDVWDEPAFEGRRTV